MKKIGLLSDTHGYFDDKLKRFFTDVDEIWHAGDIGNVEIADTIAAFKPLKAVYGNIDGGMLRVMFHEFERFTCEEVDVLMTHIGGYPGRYDPKVFKIMAQSPPKLFICGHSHILKIMYDKKHECLCLNPGAAGISGFHNVRTALRFIIDGDKISEMEVGEWKRT